MKATRDAFGDALLEAGGRHKDLVVVSCDLCGATKTKPFGEAYPDRFFEVGIAEQNGISIAAGLSMEGLRPFISSFGAFITARYDQIKTSCAYSDAPIVIVGSHSGLAIGMDGATQMGIEDVTLMSGIPGMEIFQPADARETKQIVEYLAGKRNLAYLRVSRTPHAGVFDDTYAFEFNKAKTIIHGNDIAVFATGDLVVNAIESARLLQKEGMLVDVVNFSTLKPIDREAITAYGYTRNSIVVVEDHNVIGGLGSRVCEVIAENALPARVIRHGIQGFGESGRPEDLYRKHRLDVKGIVDVVKEAYNRIA